MLLLRHNASGNFSLASYYFSRGSLCREDHKNAGWYSKTQTTRGELTNEKKKKKQQSLKKIYILLAICGQNF